jgi:hypothetical protein
MIIGIDETGNFVNDSDLKFHFFTAVQLDQNNNGIELKKEQFQKWFNTIPAEKKNKNGEIKGSDLSAEELFKFADTVIAADPVVRIIQVRIIPKENSPELISTFQEIEVKRLENLIKLYEANNKPQLAKDYKKLVIWYKNRKYAHYLKIIVLNNTICHAVEKSIGASILLGLHSKDENLLNIKIKIDKDFINADEPKIFWSDFLKSTFHRFTEKYPIPTLDDWEKTGHPFLTAYATPDGSVNFSGIMSDNTQFYHSHDHFEIQMADIAGTIIHRFQNKGTCKTSYDKLVERFPDKKHTIIQLNLNPNPDKKTDVIIT